jgi:hypothetical protein
MRIAMVSYNTFVGGEQNGWKRNGDREILLLQNETGAEWGISKSLSTKGLQAGIDECVKQVESLWSQLVEALPSMDKVFIYVGADGAERVIELASQHGLTPDKATFFSCRCNTDRKMSVAHSLGFASSRVIHCECGGQHTMEVVYRRALNEGVLPA